jgi:hypothetical protein
VIVIGNEADSLNGYVMIEFIPIGRLGLDNQSPLHGGRIIKLDSPLQYPLSDQDTGVFPPLFGRLALWCNDLVKAGTRWNPSLRRSYASEYCVT